ncbi:putative diguanylate cyclase YcdT [mine drainage metagenome]|uniref:Putative diguanylate cyclase YcdT n=1 Tax=mine drainage metagenome TaxID=410659 RepID=A0A1J5R4U4_9ZZZZ
MKREPLIQEVANLVCMLRSDVVGAIILTETRTDEAALLKICDPSCRIIVTKEVVSVISLVVQRGYQGVCGISSAGQVDNSASIFRPESGCALGLLLDYEVCDEAARATAGQNWVRAFLAEGHRLLSYAIVELLAEEPSNTERPLARHKTEKEWIDSAAALPELVASLKAENIVDKMLAVIDAVAPRGVMPELVPASNEWVRQIVANAEPVVVERDRLFWEILQWERRNRSFRVFRQWRVFEPFGMLYDQRYWIHDLKAFCMGRMGVDRICVFKLDLDNFKNVNTQLGHCGGDEAIMLASAIIRDLMAGECLLYRRGGDEFVALGLDMSADHGRRVGDLLREEMEKRFSDWCSTRAVSPAVTASIGIVFVRQFLRFDCLTESLDRTQEAAKRSGKNCVRFESLDGDRP